ncbi:helix-turn-helix transcriptional regulator [Nocardioides caeni]|uniref:Helix-turn-helix transcriptional regulator n=1 Tax=Nocardioides caeni TaxID=574700 RepID=A0A4S8N6A1_9ACTN|nr:helix-turn-helix transcriptional regulator [Nocardioides caeni]THV10439.1 helix-turn-helix transcriptional regulator [Nocardioides caeni]
MNGGNGGMTLQRKSRISPRDRAVKVGKFAAAVAARRQEINMSQIDVADLAGVARTSVAALEAGRNVSLDTLLAILDVLGLHLELARGAATTLGVSAQLEQTYDLVDRPDDDS